MEKMLPGRQWLFNGLSLALRALGIALVLELSFAGAAWAQNIGVAGTVTTVAGIHLRLPRYDRNRVDGCWLKSSQVRTVSADLLARGYDARVLVLEPLDPAEVEAARKNPSAAARHPNARSNMSLESSFEACLAASPD